MLEADPAARCSSLDEVLAHPWMNPTPGLRTPLSTYEAKATYAALRWPEEVRYDVCQAPMAPESRTSDDQNLNNILELVSRLCEAAPYNRSSTRVSGWAWTPVILKIRSRAALHWTRLFRTSKVQYINHSQPILSTGNARPAWKMPNSIPQNRRSLRCRAAIKQCGRGGQPISTPTSLARDVNFMRRFSELCTLYSSFTKRAYTTYSDMY